MATYRIVEEHNSEVTMTGFESTRKREIETKFNRFIKVLENNPYFSIERIRPCYVRYTCTGFYGSISGEYYIVRD